MKKITYNRKDLIRKLSYKINMNRNDSKIIVDCFLDVLKDVLLDDKSLSRIELRNFGVFDVVVSEERSNARNPKTKKAVVIPKRKKLIFKPSKNINKGLHMEKF